MERSANASGFGMAAPPEYSARALSTIVIDNGTSLIKAGFGGEDAPRTQCRNVVGWPRHPGVSGAMINADKDNFVGEEAIQREGILSLSNPMERGEVVNWEEMPHVWHHLFFSSLQVSSEEHPVLLTESSMTTRENREKACQIMFETFNIPAFVVANTHVMTLYSTGRSSGLVVDSGASRTHVGPVWEGYALPHYIQKLDVGGDDITAHLGAALRKEGYPFSTAADIRELTKLKETLCYTCLDAKKEDLFCKESKSQQRLYTLPDGQQVYMNENRFWSPEAMFQTKLLAAPGSESLQGDVKAPFPGLHDVINDTIQMTDPSVHREMYANVVLGGGNTLFPHFEERVQRDLSFMTPKGVTVKVAAFPERQYAAWIGGSILASLNTFPCMWVSKNEYDDYGSSIIHRKA